MAKNKNIKKEDGLADVEVALTKTEQFFEKNLNITIYAVLGVIVLVLAILGINRYMIAPKAADAQEQMFTAQSYFEKGMYEQAINGDGNALGFLDIIDDYGNTKAGKLARYYAGLSYLHLGQYQEAIDYLNKFKTDDILIGPLCESAKGDAYFELGNYTKAVQSYEAGLKKNTNDFTTPFIQLKLGLAYEAKGDKEKAKAVFQEIKDKYPSSNEFILAEKYYARLAQ